MRSGWPLALVLFLATPIQGQDPAAQPGQSPAPRPPTPSAFPPAEPNDVGMDPPALEALAKVVAELVAEGDPVGAELLIIKNRRTVLHETFGWRDREQKLPVVKGTICRIRSMTKPIVATALWLLAGEGKVAIDDPVAKHLPAFANERSRAITVDHLLTHTAGFEHPGYPAPVHGYESLRAAVDATGRAGPKDPVGGGYRYSDADSATLAALVAELSGGTAEEFITARVLEPLGMTDTFCNYRRDDPRRERVSATYLIRGEGLRKYWDPARAQTMPFFRGSGGIYSTPENYARLLALWMDRGRLGERQRLPESVVIEALTSTPGSVREDSPRHYGRHWEIFGAPITGDDIRKNGLPLFGHGGSDGTFAFASAENDLMILYFTQSRGSRKLGEVLREAAALLR